MLYFRLKKNTKLFCHFLNKNRPYLLFPLTHSFQEKNSQSLKKCDFLNLWEFFSRKLSVEEKKYKDHFCIEDDRESLGIFEN